MKIFETLNGTFINFEKLYEIRWEEDLKGYFYSFIYFEGRDKLDFLELEGLEDHNVIQSLHVLAIEYILRSKQELVRYSELFEFLSETILDSYKSTKSLKRT